MGPQGPRGERGPDGARGRDASAGIALSLDHLPDPDMRRVNNSVALDPAEIADLCGDPGGCEVTLLLDESGSGGAIRSLGVSRLFTRGDRVCTMNRLCTPDGDARVTNHVGFSPCFISDNDAAAGARDVADTGPGISAVRLAPGATAPCVVLITD